MSAPIRVGAVIHGYCGGYFGSDSHGPKRIEAIGADWIVVRTADGVPRFAEFTREFDDLDADVGRWLAEKPESRT